MTRINNQTAAIKDIGLMQADLPRQNKNTEGAAALPEKIAYEGIKIIKQPSLWTIKRDGNNLVDGNTGRCITSSGNSPLSGRCGPNECCTCETCFNCAVCETCDTCDTCHTCVVCDTCCTCHTCCTDACVE